MTTQRKSSDAATSGGIGFVGALTLLFIALKLTEVIDWSWWWVLSPVWISVGLTAALFLFGGLLVLAALLFRR